MAFYESTCIIRQDVLEADAHTLADGFEAIVKEQGGKIVKREYWGLRNLAYPINKNNRGHYIFFGLDCSADAVTELERKYRLSEDVLRSLTISVDEISKEESAVLRQEDEAQAA